MHDVYEPAYKGLVVAFPNSTQCLNNNTSHDAFDEMVVRNYREGMARPTFLWFTTATGRRLPHMFSHRLPLRSTHTPSTWNIKNSQSRSLYSTEVFSLIENCQGFLQGAPLRWRYFWADAFRLRPRRLQIAHETRPFQFPYFVTTRALHCGNSAHSAHVSRQQGSISLADFEARSDDSPSSVGLYLTTRQVTPHSEGDRANPITVAKASCEGEHIKEAIQLPHSGWRLASGSSSTVVPRRWLFKGSSPLLLNDEDALLSPEVVSELVLLSCGVDTRRRTRSSFRRASTSLTVATFQLGRHLPFTAWFRGGFCKRTPVCSWYMKQDSPVAQNPVAVSPIGPSIRAYNLGKLPQLFMSVTSQHRFFGGRAGGLKRRKPKKDPGVVIQTGLGRRQEFFWPVEARRTRVPLYQNSRPNLIFDQRFKRFMCMWYSNGIQVFRPFSCRGRRGGRGKHGAPDGLGIGRGSGTWERARAKAVALLKQLQEQGKLKNLPKPDICRSGVRGVYFDSEEKLWVATWNEHGLRRFKAFPAMEMGFDAAYQAAVAVRRQKLLENYVFCMQRNRKKSGRLPLK